MAFEKTIDEALPHNLDAEQALIGCLLFDGSAYVGLEDMISADHFFLAAHGKIFGHAMQLAKRGEPIDAIVIGHLMEGDAAYREVGGLRYMQDMVARAAPVAALANYAQIIVDAAVRRETVRLAEYMIDEAMKNRDDTAQDILSASQKNLEEVAVFGPAKASWVDLGSIYLRQLHRSRHLDGDAPGIATGIHDLDKVLGGLRPSTTNVLGARPGMGKSAVAVQIALNVAQAGYGVAFFSLEMPEEQLATRFGCALAYDRMAPVYSGKSDNPTYEDFERGELTEAQWEKLERAAGLLADLPIYMDFRSKLKVSHMAGAVRRLKREWLRRGIKPGLIICDHVLHVAGDDPKVTDPTQKFTQISGSILDMNKSLEMPTLLLAQLNRSVESRDDKRPGLSDIKFAGAMEEDAFSVSFLYRPEYYNRMPISDEEDTKNLKEWAKYHADKKRWANRLLWLAEKNRGGRGQQQVEMFCDIGCNAVQNLNINAGETGRIQFPTGGDVFG